MVNYVDEKTLKLKELIKNSSYKIDQGIETEECLNHCKVCPFADCDNCEDLFLNALLEIKGV